MIQQNEKKEAETSGIVFDIQRFSLHDGHGIRTLVFLKGCPLRCPWCTNPESQAFHPQLSFLKEKCAGCHACTEVCPHGAALEAEGTVAWAECRDCLRCVDACYFGAREACGKRMSAGEVVEIVRRDRTFYRNTAGGVTLGGGEAACQSAFAREILAGCKAAGIHTALETCGAVPWDDFRRVIEPVDLLLFDLKHMDSAKHRDFTGAGNGIILKNAAQASLVVSEMIVRLPLIPGFNDDTGNISQTGLFMKEKLSGVKKIHILPYHSVGASKCERIGRKYPFAADAAIPEKKLDEAKACFASMGFEVSVGG